MLYVNKGHVQGTLARDPYKVAEGVVLLTLRVRDDRINPLTGRRDFHYPTFVVFGRESDKALRNLVRRQEVAIEYKLETRSKMVDGERKYFEDKVATRITYGRKPEVVDEASENKTSDEAVESADVVEADEAPAVDNEEKKPVGVLAKIIEEGMKGDSAEQ